MERAREAVRATGPARVRRVLLHAGRYELRETFTLGRLDSGTSARPVTWQVAASESVTLIVGRSLPLSAWQAVTDVALLARLDPAARSQVLQADLRALGVTNVPAFPVAYHGAPPGPELFFNEKRMTLARWPTNGWATVARIVEPGSRPRDGDSRGLTGTFEYAGDRPARWRATEGIVRNSVPCTMAA